MSFEMREGGMTVGGRPQTVRGTLLTVGDDAPDFNLVANDLKVRALEDYDGKVKLLSVAGVGMQVLTGSKHDLIYPQRHAVLRRLWCACC